MFFVYASGLVIRKMNKTSDDFDKEPGNPPQYADSFRVLMTVSVMGETLDARFTVRNKDNNPHPQK